MNDLTTKEYVELFLRSYVHVLRKTCLITAGTVAGTAAVVFGLLWPIFVGAYLKRGAMMFNPDAATIPMIWAYAQIVWLVALFIGFIAWVKMPMIENND